MNGRRWLVWQDGGRAPRAGRGAWPARTRLAPKMRARATRGREHHAAANPAQQWLQRLTVVQQRPLDERHERQERVERASTP